jgi:hypothetical protein
MKFRSLLFGSAVVAMLGIAAVGCNDNPTTPNGTAPAAVTSFKATSMSATSVGLTWTPGDTVTGTTYNVSWTGDLNADKGSANGISGTSTVATGLTAGQSYTFSVTAVRNGETSSASTVKWAPADRYSSDQGNTTISIKMYEKASANGSGLLLDPTLGGPKNVSASSGLPIAELQKVQLVILANDANSTFGIGPAYAFDAYKAVNDFYSKLYIGDSTYVASSLDTWYDNKPIDQRILLPDGNISAYTGIPNAPGGTQGQGFYVRIGDAGAYHYARVFINNVGGKLLQGSAPNRYVELTISYQKTANLPYAKVAGRPTSPSGVAAHKLF